MKNKKKGYFTHIPNTSIYVITKKHYSELTQLHNVNGDKEVIKYLNETSGHFLPIASLSIAGE